MTDQEIVKGLIERDERITRDFFFIQCRPLFCSIIKKVFDYPVNYDEFVSELYYYLMKNDAAKLRSFQFRSTVYYWLKQVAIRYFIEKRDRVIDDSSQDVLYESPQEDTDSYLDSSAAYDIERLLAKMTVERYVYVIRRHILEDCEPEILAKEMNVTIKNFYNIKKRAIAQLTRVALNDIKEYGKK